MLSGDSSLRFESFLARNPNTIWLVAGIFMPKKIDNPGVFATTRNRGRGTV